MTSLLIRLALSLTGLFTTAMVVIPMSVQPYDDTELRAFLTPPDGCPAPCFMGIRPGITTVYEAFDILDKHDWVNQMNTSDSAYITWTWTGLQPGIIDPETEGTLLYQKQIVEYVKVQTTVPIGYMVLLAGAPPDRETGAGGLSGKVYVRGIYRDRFIEIFAFLPCQVTHKHFWDAPMGIEFLSAPMLSGMTGFSDINFFC